MRRATAIALLASATWATAGLTAPTTRAAEPAAIWHGSFCTRAGCSGPRASPWSASAGFGAAVLGAGWLGRRRHLPHR